MKTGSILATLAFTLVAIAHLLRLLGGIKGTVGDWSAPQWLSAVGVNALLAIVELFWTESK